MQPAEIKAEIAKIDRKLYCWGASHHPTVIAKRSALERRRQFLVGALLMGALLEDVVGVAEARS